MIIGALSLRGRAFLAPIAGLMDLAEVEALLAMLLGAEPVAGTA